MKTAYETAIQEIVEFEVEDIITTSAAVESTLPGMNDAGNDPGWNGGDSVDINDWFN